METKIEIDALSSMGEELSQVKSTLAEYAASRLTITCAGQEADAAMLLSFYEYIMTLNRNRLRKSQHKGIEKALKRKSEGAGRYGRPKTALPKDFEKCIQECVENNKALSSYCEEIGMKKSTFYKYAKRSIRTVEE